MRRTLLARLAAVAAVAGSVMACNALTGVGDLAIGSSGSSGGSGDGGPGDSATPLADGATGDANVDPNIQVIAPSLAACGTDSVCMTNSAGWSPALYLLIPGTTGCPTTWPLPKEYEMAGGGSCACNCTPSASACTGTIQTRTGTMCGGAATTLAVPTDGGCVDLGAALPAPVALTSTGTPPASCSGAVDSNLGAPQKAATCTGAVATASSSCAATEACVPKAPKASFGFPSGVLCIAHDGEAACPKNLPLRMVMGANVVDGRSCSASCSCVPSDCKSGKLETFNTAACTSAVRTLDVNGTCAPAAGSATFARYVAPTGCAVKDAPQTLGSVTVESPRTFCCTSPF